MTVRVFIEVVITGNDDVDYIFRKVSSFNVNSRFYEMNDILSLSMPYRLFQTANKDVTTILRSGAPIKVYCGHYPSKHLIFDGFIDTFTTGRQVELACEDLNYIAKRTIVDDKYFEDVSIYELLDHVVKNADFKYVVGRENMTIDKLGEFTIENNPSISDVLDVLRNTYKFIIFFRDGKLHIEPLKNINRTKHKYSVRRNVAIEDVNLEWVNKEDNRTCIHGKTTDNTTKEVTRIYYAYNLKSKKMEFTNIKPTNQRTNSVNVVGIEVDDLKKMMKALYENSYYTGYSGNFKAPMDNFVRHGETVEFYDRFSRNDKGEYVVKGVEYDFDVSSGLWQIIELGQKM